MIFALCGDCSSRQLQVAKVQIVDSMNERAELSHLHAVSLEGYRTLRRALSLAVDPDSKKSLTSRDSDK